MQCGLRMTISRSQAEATAEDLYLLREDKYCFGGKRAEFRQSESVKKTKAKLKKLGTGTTCTLLCPALEKGYY